MRCTKLSISFTPASQLHPNQRIPIPGSKFMQKIEVRYNPNCTPDGNHRFGPPEIIVPYPKESLSPAEFDEYMEIALNENSYTVAELLQYICQEGYAEVDVVEQDSEGHFVIHAEEVVYSGCSDLDFRSDFDVKLT